MSFEVLLDNIGGFGRYQIVLHLCFQIATLLYAANLVVIVPFGTILPTQKCDSNDSLGIVDSFSNDSLSTANSPPNFSKLILGTVGENGSQCHTEYPFYSFAVEWNLTGAKKHLVAVTNSVQMAGQLLGPMIMCPLADRFGRKPILLICVSGLIAAQAVSAISINWLMLTITRFFAGAFQGAAQVVHLTHFVENVPQKWRSFGNLPGFPAGDLLVALFTLEVNNWRILHWCILITTPVAMFLLIVYLKESPIWLMSVEKFHQAKQTLRYMAKQNRKLSPDVSDCIEEYVAEQRSTVLGKTRGENGERIEAVKKYSYAHLFIPSLRWTTVGLLWSRMTVSLVHFTILALVGQLSGNLSLNVIIQALGRMAIVSVFVALDLQRKVKVGRKHLLNFGITVCFSTILVVAIVQSLPYDDQRSVTIIDRSYIVRIFSLICLTCTTFIWMGIDIISTEAFPTQIRNAGTGLAMTVSRTGSVISPHLAFSSFIWAPAPAITCASVLFIDFLVVCFMVPETKGKPLPTLPSHEDAPVEKNNEACSSALIPRS